MRRFQCLCGWVSVICLVVAVGVVGLFAYPKVLFAHHFTAGGLTLYADRSHNAKATQELLERISSAMSQSPLGAPERHYELYSIRSKWREKLFFAPAPKAGGVVYPPITSRHTFLTAMDPKGDRLIKGTAVIKPPRTLSFYMVHELTHLRMHEILGSVGFYRMPHWVREGMPDYVALGSLTQSERAEILDWSGARFDLVQRFGAYPKERALVSYFIDHLGFSPEVLMSMRTQMDEALRIARADGFGGEG